MTTLADAPDLLTLVVNAVAGSPALWTLSRCNERGFHPKAHICPDHAIFDVWIERPGSGWYEMCQDAGLPGYDGVHPAWALELDECWLSWDQSSHSLQARLLQEEEDA